MKKVLLSLLLLASIGFISPSIGQTVCPQLVPNSFTITPVPASGPDCFRFSFQFFTTAASDKSLTVQFSCAGNPSQTSACIIAPGKIGNNNVIATFTSPVLCCPVATLVVTIFSNTNSDCGGTTCRITQSTGGNPPVDIPVGTLPVSFSSFSATRNKSNVSIKWETASESNNKGFNIQRLTNTAWENVAFIPSAATGGNSTSDLSYTFTDANNHKGVSQYRIQQVDIDGKAKLSEIRSVKGEAMASKLLVYPNPSATGKVSVVFDDNAPKNVQVTDMSGRVVRSLRNVSNNISIEGLESGVYSIQVTDLFSSALSVEKVIIKKR